jgi:methionyl-tRNA formyltransferase
VTTPYPGGFTFYRNTLITVWDCEEERFSCHRGTIGQILRKKDNALLVQCADGVLWLKDLEDKHGSMTFDDYKLGDKFGYNYAIEIYDLKQRVKILEERLSDERSTKE